MSNIIEVPLSLVARNPWNSHGMTDQERAALKASVIERGQLRNILVVEMDQPDEQTPELDKPYRIVDGQHLWETMCEIALETDNSATCFVHVIGYNSDLPVAHQMLIGTEINGKAARGSLEDPVKFGRMVEEMIKVRPLEEITRRTGFSEDYMSETRRLSVEPARISPGLPPINTSPRVPRVQHGLTVPMVFQDVDELAEYKQLELDVQSLVDPENKLTPGRRRIEAVMAVMRYYCAASNNFGTENVESAQAAELV
jgi:ParB-like nuclease domain